MRDKAAVDFHMYKFAQFIEFASVEILGRKLNEKDKELIEEVKKITEEKEEGSDSLIKTPNKDDSLSNLTNAEVIASTEVELEIPNNSDDKNAGQAENKNAEKI